MSVLWHRASAAEVPVDDGWLTAAEHAVLAKLVVAKRRGDWRLGRFAAKSLLETALEVAADQVEIRAADDGAPEAFVDGTRAHVSLSLSHRDDVAVAAVASLPTRVGIDLETLETRSDAFVREWLSSAEQAALPAAGEGRDLQVLRCWTGKEASAKVLRAGLRLDVRRADVVTAATMADDWVPLEVAWGAEGIIHHGWWRRDGGTVIAVVTDPPTDPPVFARAGQAATR